MDLICGSIVDENTIESYFEVFKEVFFSLHLDRGHQILSACNDSKSSQVDLKGTDMLAHGQCHIYNRWWINIMMEL